MVIHAPCTFEFQSKKWSVKTAGLRRRYLYPEMGKVSRPVRYFVSIRIVIERIFILLLRGYSCCGVCSICSVRSDHAS